MDTQRLAEMFGRYRDLEFRGSSETYTWLADACVNEPVLARPLLAAPEGQRRALLLFAAAQYQLARVRHPLRGYFASLGGTLPAGDEMVVQFRDFTARYDSELSHLCATRTTQTNEARRAALLWPAFTRAAQLLSGRPVGLVELGTSAGLLLLPDRYGYDYSGTRAGRPDAPAELVMECELRGATPDAVPAGELRLRDRVGIDLHPIAAGDSDATDWLRACVWPEHGDRLRRLGSALAEARDARLRLVAGDLVDSLPAALSTVDGVPLVFSSHALAYLGPERRAEVVRLLDEVGRGRDLALVLNEAPGCGVELFAPDWPASAAGPTVTVLTVVTWLDGVARVETQGTGGPHGAWLDWRRATFPYRPPALPAPTS